MAPWPRATNRVMAWWPTGPGEVVGVERRGRAGQLRKQTPAGLHELIGHLADHFDLDAHGW
jgi:hypothetical protein